MIETELSGVKNVNPVDNNARPVDIESDTGSESDGSVNSLPCPRIRLDFSDIRCEVPAKDKSGREFKPILKGLSGSAEPGQILAIMGCSGAGKSSLFNVLTFRFQDGTNGAKVSGSIKMNGQDADLALFRKHGAYVMQDDVLLPTQTSREALSFCANMKLPKSVSQDVKDARVDQVLKELRITKCADSFIGSRRVRGLSGGETKRVAIGVELIANPSLLFLDEPTSGLDSFTAFKLISLMKKFALSGRTVVITIHQPSLEIFQLFDKLMILSDGKMIYNGEARSALNYFSSLGFHCPITSNPADFLLRTLENNGEYSNNLNFFDAYDKSDMWKKNNYFDQTIYSDLPLLSHEQTTATDSVSTLTKFHLLSKRSFFNFIRSKETLKVRTVELLVNAIFLGTLYFQIDSSQSSITNRKGATFNMLMVTFMGSVIAVCSSFPDERPLFLREKANNMYDTTTYFLAKISSEFVFQILYPIFFSAIFYWLVGFEADLEKFSLFVLITALLQNIGFAVGFFLGATVTEAETARGLIPFCIIPFALVCGLFIVADEIPSYLKWMRWISPFRYGYEAYLVLEFLGLTLYCDSDELVYDSGVYFCPITSGNSVLTSLGLTGETLWDNLWSMFALYIVFMVAAWVMLCFRKDKL